MKRKITRRTFLRESAGLLAAVSATPFQAKALLAQEYPDIAVVEGENPAEQTRKALQVLGGISAWVQRGSRVVILPNAEWRYPGAAVNPSIAVEVARLCADAGAGSIIVTTHYGIGRWGAEVTKELQNAGARIQVPSHPKDYIAVPVPQGRVRKEVTILRAAVEHDVLIDIPVFKDHYGARISGSIKNLMGFNWRSIEFHQGQEYLHQAIADLATVIRPHLCVVDATRILAENGPGGPGRTLRPKKIYAGKDIVALDALCCPLLDLKPTDVPHIMHLEAAGLGRTDRSRMRIAQVKL